LRRSRRNRLERQAGDHRRWRCAQPGCGWVGLLPQPAAAPARAVLSAPTFSPQTRRLSRQGLVLGAAALMAAVATAWWLRPVATEAVMVGSHVVHRGTHLEGERLPSAHPLHALLPAQALENEPQGYTEADGAALRVRRHCAWGLPGRNPYRGSAAQALQTAMLSPTVVKKISADIQAGRRVDRVTISNAVIRAERSGREFDSQRVAMTYGMTMCVDTRVNFAGSHTEGADLYEAMDDDGRIYAVMVPEVCGNVSVLGQRYVRERAPPAQVAGLTSPPEDPRPWMRLPPEQRIRQLPDALRYADNDDPERRGRLNADGQDISEPGSLVLGGLALAALWLARRGRRSAAERHRQRPQD
jgi:hypothetical protein